MDIQINSTDSIELYDSLMELSSYAVKRTFLIEVENVLKRKLLNVSPDTYFLYRAKQRESSILTKEIIRDIVHEYFKVPYSRANKKTRKRELVQIRYFVFVFARKYTRDGLGAIGSLYDYSCDHATVLHAVKTMNNLKDTQRITRIDLEKIEQIIKDNYPSAVVVNNII